MAYVGVANGENILVQIGNGASPEVFAHDCMINGDRGVSLSASTVTNTVPDCTDPTLPSKTMRKVDAIDSSISGAGKMHATSVKTWMDWLVSGLPKNIRVKNNTSGSWQLAGSYVLTSLSVNGTPKTNAEVSVTLEQADAPTVSAWS